MCDTGDQSSSARLEKSEKWIFGLVYSEVHVKSHGSFFTNSWIEERLVQHSCLLSPCMTKTSSPGLTHFCDLEHFLAGRWYWRSKPMPGWRRCFSWLFCLTRDLVPPAISFWKGPDICLILETPFFERNFLSQLKMNICVWKSINCKLFNRLVLVQFQ